MTQNNNESQFPVTAPAADPVFYRTYSRRTDKDVREQWEDTVCRTIPALAKLGGFTPEEEALILLAALEHKVFPSGRWLWVGGTEWIEQPENFSGAYNCTSTDVIDWDSFGFLMDLAMMGAGTGAVLEHRYIDKLPPIRNRLNVCLTGAIGSTPIEQRRDETEVIIEGTQVTLHVGDSRIGWVKSYQALLELSSDERFEGDVAVNVDLSDVRPAGEKLKGFGGVANPIRLPDLYGRCANILNKAVGRKLSSIECCLLIDEAAVVVVAGNVRRSAAIKQFNSDDPEAAAAKDNLWQEGSDGKWRIDPERDALRMSNHTRVFHHKPTLEECIASVRKQYYSGEGAIQWAGEAKRRAGGNARYGLNPCGEIIGQTFHCNLSEVHLNQIDPNDHQDQDDAFRAGAIAVAALLHHQFTEPRYQKSREEDPIVGVSFTGLFDFFVNAFGADWLKWWEDGRPDTVTGLRLKQQEKEYLSRWSDIVHQVVWDYCDRHDLKRPNRCTTVQPAGCLDRTALRVFDQGLIYADEHMQDGSGVNDLEFFGLSVRDGISVMSGIANEPRDMIRIKLCSGRELTMTYDHRLSVAGCWVLAGDMSRGMELDWSIGEYKSETEPSLVKPVEEEGCIGRPPQPISYPSHLTPALAYCIGNMFGNGSIEAAKYRICFTHGTHAVLERIGSIFSELFSIQGCYKSGSRGGNFEHLVLSSKKLYLFLSANGLLKDAKSAELNRVPMTIRQGSRKTILAFISGLLDSDGYVSKTGAEISSTSREFLRCVQQVSEAVGICWKLGEPRQQQGTWEGRDVSRLTIKKLFCEVDSLNVINSFSVKAAASPLTVSRAAYGRSPFEIVSIETVSGCFSFDYEVNGIDYDDSWYWQGAIKSHNTKSLLTGASSGWAPPKAQRFIRRITFGKNDPVALACLDYGYSIVPSQSDKDESGQLLDDPFDPRCTEWLVEIPTEVPWANLPGADTVDISQFSALAQFDFYMQVQKYYTTHNTSATIELREPEVEALGHRIFEAIRDDEGYISSALLARFDDHETFPRLPFEPISKAKYEQLRSEVLARRTVTTFAEAIAKHDQPDGAEAGPAGCDGDKCLFSAK